MRDVEADTVQVAIFAKAPVAGYAKTRLIPRLGCAGAARLQADLIRRTVQATLESSLRPISLWCTPDQSHELFASLSKETEIEAHVQCGADLGARMLQAFEQLTKRGPLILIGTDCPVLAPRDLEQCAAALCKGDDAVFIPAEDGGYVLVGLKQPIPQIFETIPWSTSDVMRKTRERLVALGLRVFEADILWDIDTPADYERARALNLI